MSFSGILKYRKKNAITQLVRKLTFGDVVNIAVLLISILAIVIAIVAIRHADDSGNVMIGQLKEQIKQLDTSRALLGKSEKTLGDLLSQAQDQATSNQLVISDLNTQLSLSRAQGELSAKQVETLQREFGKKPNLLAPFNCNEDPSPQMIAIKQGPDVLSYSPDHPIKGADHFVIQKYMNKDDLKCWISLSNDGNLDAEVMSLEAQLGPRSGPGMPFPQGRYTSFGGDTPTFAYIDFSMIGKQSTNQDGKVEGSYPVRVLQSRFGNSEIQIPVLIRVQSNVTSFSIDITIRGENFDQKQFGVSVTIQ